MTIHNSLVNALSSIAADLLADLGRARELLGSLREVGFYELKTRHDPPPTVAAGDSSYALRSYSMALVYAAQAAAVKVSPRDRGQRESIVVEADAGYYLPGLASDEVVTEELLRRAVQFISRELEVLAARRAAEGAEVALFDGSMFSFLWYGKLPEIPKSFFSYRVRPRKFRDLWSSVAMGVVEIARSGAVPVFVAKTVRRSYYVGRLLGREGGETPARLRGRVNDLILLGLLRASGRLPRSPFILEPMYVERVEDLPRPLNSLEPGDRELVEPLVPATLTYVVFNPAAHPYQITVPGRWSVDELVDLLSSIYQYSRSGYPDPLRVAHWQSKITGRELRLVLAKVGLRAIPTGRELLGEFA